LPGRDSSGCFKKLVIVQEFPQILNEGQEEKLIENKTYFPYTLDIMLIYSDRIEFIKKLQILPKKINVITLDSDYQYPEFILLNPYDYAYMTQNLSKIPEDIVRNFPVKFY
jgi:hypothetical protein